MGNTKSKDERERMYRFPTSPKEIFEQTPPGMDTTERMLRVEIMKMLDVLCQAHPQRVIDEFFIEKSKIFR